jgi:hypothetical protein
MDAGQMDAGQKAITKAMSPPYHFVTGELKINRTFSINFMFRQNFL